jgi:hypothetical protein
MKIVTADKYRHFTPKSNELVFNIPSTPGNGSNTLMYQYLIRTEAERTQKMLPSAMWSIPENRCIVYIDNVLQKQIVNVLTAPYVWTAMVAYAKNTQYLMTYMAYTSSYYHPYGQLLDHVTVPPKIGSTVKIVSTDTYDGWYHLDIKKLLIQGANPADNLVLGAHENFQGGYRVDYVALDNVKYGELRRCDYQTGWDYKAPLGYRGIDSFSYHLVTEFGQVSEPSCCSIRVGY